VFLFSKKQKGVDSMTNPKIISFPCDNAYFPSDASSLSQGGICMTIKHQHPTYTSEKERLERLRDIKKLCAIKLHGQANGSRTA